MKRELIQGSITLWSPFRATREEGCASVASRKRASFGRVVEDVADVCDVHLTAAADRGIPAHEAAVATGSDVKIHAESPAGRSVLHFRDGNE